MIKDVQNVMLAMIFKEQNAIYTLLIAMNIILQAIVKIVLIIMIYMIIYVILI